MTITDNIIKLIEADLEKAKYQRGRIRKQVDVGALDETHLSYADGLVDGLGSAVATILNIIKETK